MSEIDQKGDELRCSFCKERFSDVVKLIPECYNNICGACYEDLKAGMDDEENKEYKCEACGERHTLPSIGLRDNKPFLALLSKMKPPEKALHPNAKRLRELMRKVEDQMEKLVTFDEKEFIQTYCERIELEASEAIEKAIKHLQEIETKMMKQISEYRERCLANHHFKQISEPQNATKCELNALMKEVDEFNAKWNDYFGRIEVYATENEIEDALVQTALYVSTMESVEVRMKKEALNSEEMVFKVNSQFLEEWNHVGEIDIIGEIETNQRKEPPKTSMNPVNSTQPKKMTVQETPSFTLSGHSDSVLQMLFLRDGRMASCSSDKTIKIWNVENGKELFQLKGHTNDVLSIALLPNGHLASGSLDRTIKIWDLEQRKEIRSIEAHSKWICSLRVLKSGNLASYSHDDTIKIWNLNSKENEPVSTMRGHGNTTWWAQLFGILSNDFLVTCSRHPTSKEECILRVWNPNEPNSSIKSVPTGFNDVRSLLVLSNDQVALGFKESGTIKIIDLNNKALSRTIEKAHDKFVSSLAQLSNGNLISAGKDASTCNIKVWNLFDLRLLQTINSGHFYWIWSLSISGDERFLASGSKDNTNKLWPISTE